MKLEQEYQMVLEKFKSVQDKIPSYAEKLKETGGYQDFRRRLAWDLMNALIDSSTMCQWYNKYDCNDNHITTLAKKALKAVYPE